MRPRHFLRSLLLALLAGCCPSLTGCFSGWAYPSVSVIPPVAFTPNKEEMRAFRVDVKDDVLAMDVGEYDRYELSEIKGTKQYAPQLKLAVDHGWYMINAVSFGQHTQYTLKVRLYRPGYETVEISSWELLKSVEWKPVADVAAQEAAVDALVSTWETKSWLMRSLYREKPSETDLSVPPTDVSVFDALAHGSSSPDHRNALLFAATEYERVRDLAIAPEQLTIKERVATKAAKLRELAAE